MSLGIYDAFIFDQSYTMEELTKKIDILRKDVKKLLIFNYTNMYWKSFYIAIF